uniref:Uncharacterized protein n=1 Tax=Globisporangium ultimum (strain ATCC 200006 / CBS 805.95 / DAOM BR144) TaxID=431595 RepID=K3W9P0_GLOUD
MGLPSPQIDNSQLPSVLAMSNANNSNSQRPLYEPPTPLTASLFGLSGPPSITRGGGRNSYLSLGMFPTADKQPHHNGNGAGHDEDIDSFINSYSKFMGPEAASPITYHHHQNQYAMPPLLDNIGLNVFESNTHHAAAASMNAARNQMHNNHSQGSGPQPLQRLKIDYMANNHGNSHHGHAFEGFPTPNGPVEGASHDYTAQFFADNGGNLNMGKGDHHKGARVVMKAKAPPVPKPTGVTAA